MSIINNSIVGSIGTSTVKIVSTAYSYISTYFVPKREFFVNGNGITSNEISSIVENYTKLQSRQKSTELILKLESTYYDELSDKIDQLKILDGDNYLFDWIKLLEQRKLEIKKNITILEHNKVLYENIPSIKKNIKTVVSDDDEFWLCTICEENRKNTALNCGHVFCSVCVDRFNKCPNCKVNIQKDAIKSIYL
jgi:hypothetical protein